jgi:hypothetical protein
MFTFLGLKLEDKRFCTEWQQAFPDFSLLFISSWMEFFFFQIFKLFHSSRGFITHSYLCYFVLLI